MPLIDKLKLEEINYDPKYYNNVDRGKLGRVARSISKIKVLEALIVEEKQDDYMLLTGKDHFKALKKGDREETSAIIVKSHEIEDEEIELFEEFQPEPMDPLEKALVIQNYIDENNLTKKEASKELDVARTTLTSWLVILEFPKKYQKKVIDNHEGKNSPLTISHLEKAKRIKSRTNNFTYSQKLLDASLEYNLTSSECDKLYQMIKKQPDINIMEAAKVIREKNELENQQNGFIYNDLKKLMNEIDNNFEELENKLKKINKHIENKNNDYIEEALKNKFLLFNQKLNEICLETIGNNIKELENK